ncbi:MAG: Omp28-related outer membrane protein [Bacteroidota bacterium]
MRKILSLFVILLTAGFLYGQTVPRNMVVLEISTGTWCTYCPGAANAADQLLTEGKSVAVIEYHNGDAYVNAASNARNSYYGITGYPTGNFDGTVPSVGGAACPSGNVYSTYLPLYNTAIGTASLLNICMSGSNVGNNYTVNVQVKKIGTITSTNLRLHLVVTESDITTAPWPGSGGCMTKVNDVERAMVPDYNGTTFTFGSGDIQNFTLNFTKDPTWVLANCHLVAFVQDNATKQIFNGIKSPLASLPGSLMTLTDFAGAPLTGCSPLSVNFTSSTTGATTYNWAFPGGTPSTSTVANPTNISYSNAGGFGAGLKITNGVCKDSLGKANYINVSGSAGTPGTPVGTSSMCVNPMPQTYTTTGAANATSYVWDIQPVAAGTLTPSGTSCVVNFAAGWIGTAQLKVQGISSCGNGPWSSSLAITVSTPPAKPGTPTGPTSLCVNAANTDYVTTGSAGATMYVWDVTPTSAGTINSSSTTGTIDWNNTFTGTATIKVIAYIGGCEGVWSDAITVTVSAAPAVHNTTGGGAYCSTGGTGMPVGVDGSETGVNYTLYKNGTATTNIVPGTGAAISFGNQTQAATYTVVAAPSGSGTCSTNMNGNAVVTIDTQVPNVPATPSGPGQPNAGTSTDYTTAGGTYATSYSWHVSPSNAGTPSGSTATGTITWNASYTGPASVTVQGVNSCGSSANSISFDVTVLPATGISVNSIDKIISVYPNPAKEILNIVSIKNVKVAIRVLNVAGTSVIDLQNVSIDGTYKLNISSLTPGVYYLHFTGSDLQQVQKIVVE